MVSKVTTWYILGCCFHKGLASVHNWDWEYVPDTIYLLSDKLLS